MNGEGNTGQARAYRWYLRAELRKLKNSKDAVDFAKKSPPGFVASDPKELTGYFADGLAVDAFVQGLSDERLRVLTAHCDCNWRDNGIAASIAGHADSKIVSAAVSSNLPATRGRTPSRPV